MQTLCIFLVSGATFTFKGVKITSNNQTHLAFTYRAMSDGNEKTGNFIKENMAGWSTFDDD